MNRLLLITGDLATGKSTFSTILSNRYNSCVFNKDTLKEAMSDTIGFTNREENLRLSAAAMELMLLIFKEFAGFGKDLILEANFHKADLDRFHEIARANQYEVLILVFRGDVEILHKRYVNRIENENRHPVHLSTTLHIFEDFKAYLEDARKEAIDGNVISVRADDFSYQTDKGLLSKIDEFMGQRRQ